MKRFFFLSLACLLCGITAFSPVLPPVPDLPADQAQDFEEAAEIYLNSLQVYLGDIAKTNDAARVNRLFEHVKDLFVDKNQIIEVGWIANGRLVKEKYTVQKYLERLQGRKNTVYSQMEISGYQKSAMVSPFSKTNQRNLFKAVYDYFQTFKGYQGKTMVYGDKTTKKVEVFADKRKPNETQVKLGNIYVDKIDLISPQPRGAKAARVDEKEGGAAANEEILMVQRQAETLLDQVNKQKPTSVRLVGKKNNTTRVLTIAQFREKYAFKEFERYGFKEAKNNEAIIQLQ